MTFDLPMPPSVNAMYIMRAVKGRTGRSLAFGYRKWRDGARLIVKDAWQAAGEPVFTAPLSVSIEINLDRRSDIDNRIKACLDVLGKSIPEFPDDRYIDYLRISRDTSIIGARVTISDASSAVHLAGALSTGNSAQTGWCDGEGARIESSMRTTCTELNATALQGEGA